MLRHVAHNVCSFPQRNALDFSPRRGIFEEPDRDPEYGFQSIHALERSRGREGKSLPAVPGRYGSGIRGASAIGPGRLISVEKDRGTDPCRGEIDATLKSETRVLTCIMEASSGSGWLDRPPRCVSSSPTGPPCRARLDLVSKRGFLRGKQGIWDQ